MDSDPELRYRSHVDASLPPIYVACKDEVACFRINSNIKVCGQKLNYKYSISPL